MQLRYSFLLIITNIYKEIEKKTIILENYMLTLQITSIQ